MDSNLLTRIYISSVYCLLISVSKRFAAADNFGLLYGTLTSFQTHACDGEELRLNCTRNTVIAVNYFFYGRRENSENLCPAAYAHNSESCQLNEALRVIEERCRGQVMCRLFISPDTFYGDPCPGTRKYAEVSYKCRPENYRNKVVCEGESLQLSCPVGQRLAIYKATFGSTRFETAECPQAYGVREECQASFATETVMRHCVGEQSCTIKADVSTFDSPHCNGRKHLKVAYSCVLSRILNTSFRDTTASGEAIQTTSFPAWAHGVVPAREVMNRSLAYSVAASTERTHLFKSEMQSDEVPTGNSEGKASSRKQELVGFMSEWMSAHKYMTGNKDKLILYVSLSVAVGFIAFVSVLAARLYIMRSRSKNKSKDRFPPPIEDPFFSDSDMEQYDAPNGLPTPMVNYTASIRRKDSDAQPRAPLTNGDDHYFS